MLEETRIKLIGAGLILATIVIGVLIFSQRSTSNTNKNLNLPKVVQASPVATPSSLARVVVSPSPAVKGTKTSSLPNTGFPAGLFVIFSTSVAIAGWGLRKFPK